MCRHVENCYAGLDVENKGIFLLIFECAFTFKDVKASLNIGMPLRRSPVLNSVCILKSRACHLVFNCAGTGYSIAFASVLYLWMN